MTTIFLLAFWFYLLGAISTGWWAGDRHDRKAICAICAAALATGLANQFFVLETALAFCVVVDFALLASLTRYAMRSKRYWPIWFVGFHAVICLLGIVAVFVPVTTLRLDILGGFWAVAALTVMTLGLLKDRQESSRPS